MGVQVLNTSRSAHADADQRQREADHHGEVGVAHGKEDRRQTLSKAGETPSGARTGDPEGSRGITLPRVGARRIGWPARSRARWGGRRGCYSKMARIL